MERKPEQLCPFCGSQNDCAMAQGGDGSSCWCREIFIAPAVLERVRELSGGKSCICQKCATALAGIVDARQAIVRLYGTAACHLCEEAEQLVRAAGALPVHIDIAEDDALSEKYGLRIPVLQRIDNGLELGWPFDGAMLSRFLF